MTSGLKGKEAGGQTAGLTDLLFLTFLEIRASFTFHELPENKGEATDLASHAPAVTELIIWLPKRPQHLLPEQSKSTLWSSTLRQGAGDIWLRLLRVSTPADAHGFP